MTQRSAEKSTATTIEKGYYRHFKGGIYRVWATARHSETTELMVVYERVADGSLWVRPQKMWYETVCRDDYQGPRFVYIGQEKEKACKKKDG